MKNTLLLSLFASQLCLVSQASPPPEFSLSGESSYYAAKVFKVMAAKLYLSDLEHQASVLSDIPKKIDFTYHRNISVERFVEAANDALKDNVSAEELTALKERIGILHGRYTDVKKGDTYSFVYHPGKGTTLLVNQKEMVTIAGADFAAAYFSIWLGESPISEKFRRELLGLKK